MTKFKILCCAVICVFMFANSVTDSFAAEESTEDYYKTVQETKIDGMDYVSYRYLSAKGTVYSSKSGNNQIKQYVAKAGNEYLIEGLNKLSVSGYTMVSFAEKAFDSSINQKTIPIITYTKEMESVSTKYVAEKDGYIFVAYNTTKPNSICIREKECNKDEEDQFIQVEETKIDGMDYVGCRYLSAKGTVYSSKSGNNQIKQYVAKAGNEYLIEGLNKLSVSGYTMVSFAEKAFDSSINQKTIPIIVYTEGMESVSTKYVAEKDGYIFVAYNTAKPNSISIKEKECNKDEDVNEAFLWGCESGYSKNDVNKTSPVEKRAFLVTNNSIYFTEEYILYKVNVDDSSDIQAILDFRTLEGYTIQDRDLCSSIVSYGDNIIITMRTMTNVKVSADTKIGAIISVKAETLAVNSVTYLKDKYYISNSSYPQIRPTGSVIYNDLLVTGLLCGGFRVDRILSDGSISDTILYESNPISCGTGFYEMQKPVFDETSNLILFPRYGRGIASYRISDKDGCVNVELTSEYDFKKNGGGYCINLTIENGYVFAPVCKTSKPGVFCAKISDMKGTAQMCYVPEEYISRIGTAGQVGDVSPNQISMRKDGTIAINIDYAGVGFFAFKNGVLTWLGCEFEPKNNGEYIVAVRGVLFDDNTNKLWISYKYIAGQEIIGTYIKGMAY